MSSESLIQVCNTGFYICLVIAIICLLLGIFLFFRFDIRTIFEIRTGRAARREIQKLDEENAKTGKLKTDNSLEFTSGNLSWTTSENLNGDKPKDNRLLTDEISPVAMASSEAAVGETTILSSPPVQDEQAGVSFVITQNILVIHSDEICE